MSRDDKINAIAAKIKTGELTGLSLIKTLMELSPTEKAHPGIVRAMDYRAKEEELSSATSPEMSVDGSQEAVSSSSDDEALSVSEVKAIAKETGEPQPHPTHPNVRIKPNGKFSPALGYTWVDPDAAGDFRVKKETEAPKKYKSDMFPFPRRLQDKVF